MTQILVIEDEISYLKLLRRHLSLEGYGMLEATDGKKGLEMAIQHRPDLILLDVRVPVMNGINVLNELRKDEYGKTVKVILLTNIDPDDQTIQEVVQNQPSFYLIKSNVELSELMKKIKILLQA